MKLTRTEVDTDGQRHGGNEGRAQFKTPCDVTDVVDGKIGGETQEDTESSLHQDRDGD